MNEAIGGDVSLIETFQIIAFLLGSLSAVAALFFRFREKIPVLSEVELDPTQWTAKLVLPTTIAVTVVTYGLTVVLFFVPPEELNNGLPDSVIDLSSHDSTIAPVGPTDLPEPASVPPPVTAQVSPDSTIPTGVPTAPPERTSIPWLIAGGRSVLDPNGRRWEKYRFEADLPGLYLRMDKPENIGDSLILHPNGEFEWEEGGEVTRGAWEQKGKIIQFSPR